ncbi:flagellar biosynthesis protein FlhA [bacterium]|nr:flagellar biosynthesis protein FlhA [bacterium]
MANETRAGFWTRIQWTDLLAPALMVVVLGIMLIRIPPNLLDFLLVIDIAGSLVVLLVGFYIIKPLEFSTFPAILLVATLYRLSLNVASTKLILSETTLASPQDKAGNLIKFFGRYVAGDDPVVGIVIFAILVLIMFVVITRGAGRIAEVAARFTLDAMPGKQMAIDADLNSGLISEADARRRRAEIAREADFYGAMDGASKFVRGDAIAGLFITLINILGGIVIGLLRDNLPFGEVVRNYTILTIGDGLVTQIPALLVATAAGIVTTRAAGETTLGKNLFQQIFAQSAALGIASGTMAVLGLFGLFDAQSRGIALPSLVIAGLLAYGAWRIRREGEERVAREKTEAAAAAATAAAREPEKVEALLTVDPMEIRIGYALIPIVDAAQGGDLLDRVKEIRRKMAMELGIVVPPIRICDDMHLDPRVYSIRIRGVQVGHGDLSPDGFLVMSPDSDLSAVPGTRTTEPAFGLPAKWIEKDQRRRAEMAGYNVIEPAAVLATHLTEVIRGHAAQLLGRQEVQQLLDNLREAQPVVVRELLEVAQVKLGTVQKTLQNLLRERVPIRNLATILETIADYADRTNHNPELLAEYARMALARSIVDRHLGPDRRLGVITLDPELEQALVEGISRGGEPGYGAVDPRLTDALVRAVEEEAARRSAAGAEAILLVNPQVRLFVRRVLERTLPGVTVLSYNEITPDVRVERVGTVRSPGASQEV